jgi:hypothetical protein
VPQSLDFSSRAMRELGLALAQLNAVQAVTTQSLASDDFSYSHSRSRTLS